MLVQNACFGAAHIGTAMTLHARISQRKDTSCAKSVLLSATGSLLFNYGSLLILANVKQYLPQSELLRYVIGMGAVGFLFYVGAEYLQLLSQEELPID